MVLITRSLPDSFAPIMITLSSVGLGFKQFLAAIRAEVDRRKAKGTPLTDVSHLPLSSQARRANRNLSKFRGDCHYCGKPGHMKRSCRKRMADEARNSSNGRRERGRGRRNHQRGAASWNKDQQVPWGGKHEANNGWVENVDSAQR